MFDCQEPSRVVRKIEWALVGLVSLLTIYLQIVLYQNAGSFWRDEVSSITIAGKPSFGAMWTSLPSDSFPALFATLLRVWIFAGPGATESGIRLFGTLLALGVVAAVIISCKTLTGRLPVLAFSLIALNGTMFYFGSSIRAYGLAALLIILCCVAFYKLAQRPSILHGAAALILAIISAHANYQNSYCLLGIGIAAAGVCAISRLWIRSLLILTLCSISALSLLIYLPIITTYTMATATTRFDLHWKQITGEFIEALAGSHDALKLFWGVVLIAATFSLIIQYVRQSGSDSGRQNPSIELYCLIMALIAGAAGFTFFKMNSMFPFPWHYAPFIVLVGIIVEVGIRSPRHVAWVSYTRLVVSCLVILFSMQPIWKLAHVRRTNLDLVSSVVAREAGAHDLVLLAPYFLSTGFSYHYKGQAEWSTLPSLPKEEGSTIVDYSNIKKLMVRTDGIEPTLSRIRDTLAAGHRLWIVGGGVIFLPPKTLPPHLPPAPQLKSGWNSTPYIQAWSMQVGYFIQTHGDRLSIIPVPLDQPVNGFENVPLMLVTGWRK